MSSSFATFLFPLSLFFLLPSYCNLEFPLVHPLISLLLLLLLVFYTIVFHLLLLFLLLLFFLKFIFFLFLLLLHLIRDSLSSTPPLQSSASAINPIVIESNRYICFFCCFSLLLSHHFNRHRNLSGFTGAMNFSDFNTIGVTAIPLLIIPNIVNIQQATDNVVDND